MLLCSWPLTFTWRRKVHKERRISLKASIKRPISAEVLLQPCPSLYRETQSLRRLDNESLRDFYLIIPGANMYEHIHLRWEKWRRIDALQYSALPRAAVKSMILLFLTWGFVCVAAHPAGLLHFPLDARLLCLRTGRFELRGWVQRGLSSS